MLNLTSRLAVKIRNLPDFTFDWSDKTPQRPQQSLGISDFLPNDEDASALQQRAVTFVMEFLVTHFKHLRNLKQYVPEKTPLHPPKKSEVIPMKILFKDEKYKSETIDILSQLVTDANLDGSNQVSIQHLQVFTKLMLT